MQGGRKMLKMKLKNQKGFTLIEIIAVLVILGILAAVAVPKYMDLQVEAKQKAAQGQVAEIKGTLSSAYGKAMLAGNGNATAADVLLNAGISSGTPFNVGTAPDIWYQTVTLSGNVATISVTKRDTDTGYNATGNWTFPQ